MLYPETKGRALEDMDGLFGRSEDRNSSVLLEGGEGWDERQEDDGGGEARQSMDSTEEDAPLLGP